MQIYSLLLTSWVVLHFFNYYKRQGAPLHSCESISLPLIDVRRTNRSPYHRLPWVASVRTRKRSDGTFSSTRLYCVSHMEWGSPSPHIVRRTGRVSDSNNRGLSKAIPSDNRTSPSKFVWKTGKRSDYNLRAIDYSEIYNFKNLYTLCLPTPKNY